MKVTLEIRLHENDKVSKSPWILLLGSFIKEVNKWVRLLKSSCRSSLRSMCAKFYP